MVLASHLSILSFGIAEIRREHLLPIPTKNANKTDGWSELLRVFSMHRENFPENLETKQSYKLLIDIFSVVAPGRQSLTTVTT
ncbi:hypothetical protein ACVW1C_004987 [Bradyrhizobium sp. USDA 4011]